MAKFKPWKRYPRSNGSGTQNGAAFGLGVIGLVILIAVFLEVLIRLSQILFPIFVVLTVLAGILLVTSIFKFQKYVWHIGIVFGALLILCGITYVMGYVIGNSSFGLSITNIAGIVRISPM